ncbi:MAG: AMP-binding protein [Clostridiales bacterium]|jgi:long-chain acyl-CoA synthetase|nr:AMP-binding protein [Clostridiales bacterium]
MNKEFEVWKQNNEALFAQPELENFQQMIRRAAEMHGDKAAVAERVGDSVVEHSANELRHTVEAIGTALIDLGLDGKNIAIIGENSYPWILAFLSIVCGVGTAVPLDKELTDKELCKLITKGDVEAVFASSTYVNAVKLHKEQSDSLRYQFLLTPGSEEGFIGIDELIAKGEALLNAGDRRYLDKEISPDDLVAIFFTSGTTGANKGVMLTHRNMTNNIEGMVQNVVFRESTFSILPMNHIYELNCNVLPLIYIGVKICINDSLKNLMANFQLFKPHMVMLVPIFVETFYNSIWAEAEKTGQAEKLRQAVEYSNSLLNQGIDKRAEIFASIRQKFGGNLSLMISGGAPCNPKFLKGLGDFGFRIYVGYGLTEAAPIASLNLDGGTYPESTGIPFHTTQYMLYEPDADGIGEVWLRGDSITKGYYKDEQATKDSFEDGWFKTGDYGRIDQHGHLCLVGRKKSLIILNNGKNVHPEEIENLVKDEITYIREIVVLEAQKEILGTAQQIIAAIAFIDTSDFPEMSLSEIWEMASADINKVNKKLPGYKMIRDVTVITEDFEKTSTKKIIRQKAIEKYQLVSSK